MAGKSIPLGALLLGLSSCFLAGSAEAESSDIRVMCAWDAGGSAYQDELAVNLADRRVIRSGGGLPYRLLQASDRALWLMVEERGSAYLAIQVIERFSDGDRSDIVILPNGEALSTSGGQCTER